MRLNRAGHDALSDFWTDYSFNLGLAAEQTEFVITWSGSVAVGNW